MVRWCISREAGGDRFRFFWQERGGPPVRPPAYTSLGSRLIQSALPQPNGEAPLLAYDAEGFRYEVSVALTDVVESE